MLLRPDSLSVGDTIAVSAPSRSLSLIDESIIAIAIKNFEILGLNLKFVKHARETKLFHAVSIEGKITDLHDAFFDNTVKGIFTVLRGFNLNQILPHID